MEEARNRNSKGHLYISLVKSFIRCGGGLITTVYATIMPLAIFIIIAEILGILEEMVDER